MALRHLNKLVGRSSELKMRPIKAGVLYKMISTC
jgi:hypothetical protein